MYVSCGAAPCYRWPLEMSLCGAKCCNISWQTMTVQWHGRRPAPLHNDGTQNAIVSQT